MFFVRLAVVPLPPRSTAPVVVGCCLLGFSVIIGRPLHRRAVAGVSQRVRVGLRPVLVSRDPSPLAAARRGQGRVPIAEESPGPGAARTIQILNIISARPSKPLMVRTFLKVYMELGSCFVSQ